MRLNPDCIRDILFFVEDNTTYRKPVLFSNNVNDFNIVLKNFYSPEEILYHLELCEEYGYVIIGTNTISHIWVNRLTKSGHEFLETIRQDNNWSKTKNIAREIGSFSLETLKDIASNVISNLLTNNFK